MASKKPEKPKGAYCCVVGCRRNSVRDKSEVNFFIFPTRNQEKRQLWIKAVNRKVSQFDVEWRACVGHQLHYSYNKLLCGRK